MFSDFVHGLSQFSGILGMLLGASITYILTANKIKKERKARYQDVIGAKIAEALLETRKLERKIREKEEYDEDAITNPEKRIDFFEGNITYPGIFTSSERFFEFQEKISHIRREYEEFLTYKEVALLIVIENYCMNVLEFAGKEEVVDFPLLGSLLGRDLWKWHLYFDKVIVKDNNRQRCKMVSCSGTRWKCIRGYVLWKFWKRTDLYALRNSSQKKRIIEARKILAARREGIL